MRCTKTGHRCDGYQDLKPMAQRRRRSALPVVDGAERPPVSVTPLYEWTSADEKRSFDFFTHVTAPCLSGELDALFWQVLVLQICQTEPAVRHAVLAIGSLHEGMIRATTRTPYTDTENRRNPFALHQYNRAIACLLDQMRAVDARPLVLLLTCVLFVCIELIQSKDRESLIHLEQGRQILSRLGRKADVRNPDINLIKQHLVPTYTRLSLAPLMFGGDAVAIPTPLKTLTEVPVVFEKIDQVRYTLYDLMDECLRFAKRSHVAKISHISAADMRAFESEQDYLLRKLAKFKVAFSLYQATRARDASSGSIALIQVHVHTTLIWISTALNQRETVFDDHLDAFSAIIPLATEFMDSLTAHSSNAITQEQHVAGGASGSTTAVAGARHLSVVFTFEMHIIAPLYFVAAKCRHPVIRRAALRLLRRHPSRRENLWRANIMAAIAERAMRLEERHLRPPEVGGPPQPRPVSPVELAAPFPPNSFWQGGDAWASSVSGVPFPASFGPADLDAQRASVSRPSVDEFAATYAPVTSSISSSAPAIPGVDIGRYGDLDGAPAGRMPVDPTLYFNTPEVPSFAQSLTAATPESSLIMTTSSSFSALNGHGPQRYAGIGVENHAGPALAMTVPRSADAPFDVPERFRVHESIIGPDSEDGTSWVMMFRKLHGLDANWDVLTMLLLHRPGNCGVWYGLGGGLSGVDSRGYVLGYRLLGWDGWIDCIPSFWRASDKTSPERSGTMCLGKRLSGLG